MITTWQSLSLSRLTVSASPANAAKFSVECSLLISDVVPILITTTVLPSYRPPTVEGLGVDESTRSWRKLRSWSATSTTGMFNFISSPSLKVLLIAFTLDSIQDSGLQMAERIHTTR